MRRLGLSSIKVLKVPGDTSVIGICTWKGVRRPALGYPTGNVLREGKNHLFAYPAHILALGSGGEGLGADDGASSEKRPWGWRAHPPVLGPHHCGRRGRGLCVGLFVHLGEKPQL